MDKKNNKPVGELIYGIHPLIEVLKAKRRKVISIYTTKPEPKAWQQHIAPLIAEKRIPIQYVQRSILDRMAGTSDHQSIVAWVQPFVFRSKPFDPQKHPFLLMLDGIQDTKNLGAILRSAYCTGVSGIILTKKFSAPINAATLKASAGLAEHLEIHIAQTPLTAAQDLTKQGYHLYLAAFNGQDATTVNYTKPLVIVIGSEGEGISQGMQKFGTIVTLPQRTPDISYNASVAAGILLFIISQNIKLS